MNKDQVIKSLQTLNDNKRNFLQSFDLIITLKDLDTKVNPVDVYITLPYPRGKKVKVAALVGQELADEAQKECDLVIRETEFAEYKDPKKAKKLARSYDFFIAQATLMPQIAQVFGRSFGPLGKMPNPKAGCVVPPNANIKTLIERLQKTVHVKAKGMLAVQCITGNEKMEAEQVADNVITIYNNLSKQLPSESMNIDSVLIKKTMSKPVKV